MSARLKAGLGASKPANKTKRVVSSSDKPSTEQPPVVIFKRRNGLLAIKLYYRSIMTKLYGPSMKTMLGSNLISFTFSPIFNVISSNHFEFDRNFEKWIEILD